MEAGIAITGPGMEKLDEGSPTGRVNVPAPESWIERLDEWRIKQRPILGRAEAVRKLVTEALDTRERTSKLRG